MTGILSSTLPLALLTGVVSFLMCLMTLKLLTRLMVLDRPEGRSNHRVPVPVGGGLGFMTVIILALITKDWAGSAIFSPLLVLSLMLLLAVSFADDAWKLSVKTRLTAQAIAILLTMFVLQDILSLSALPLMLCAMALFWFTNLYNFMDGADGLAATETIIISTGMAISGHLRDASDLTETGVIIAACVSGFLPLNWQRARIFMGDSGSITLGFLIGYLLIVMAGNGMLAAALILPAYFVLDASYTITTRLLRGERIWQAHSQHAYQQAVRGGMQHRNVAISVGALGIMNIALACFATLKPESGATCVIAAYMLAAGLMRCFMRRKVR